MSQREINQAEWENPTNWTETMLFNIYFSKRDSRVWVPKHRRWDGPTLNFGHPTGVTLFGSLLLALVVGSLSTIVLAVT